MEEEKIHHEETRSDDELRTLKEILETQKKSVKELESIKRSLLYLRFGGILKFLLILIPLIVGIIYLPPLIQNYLKGIEEVQRGIFPLFETFRDLERTNSPFSN